jgi:hypothetical protein
MRSILLKLTLPAMPPKLISNRTELQQTEPICTPQPKVAQFSNTMPLPFSWLSILTFWAQWWLWWASSWHSSATSS